MGLALRRGGGRPVVDSAWGEWLLNIRTPRKRVRLARIVGRPTSGGPVTATAPGWPSYCVTWH